MWLIATAYVATCLGCTGVTASGVKADWRQNIIAASPAWPMGTCLELELTPGKWTRFTVKDRGPHKPNHVDILMRTKKDAIDWGRQKIQARKCGKAK